MQKGWKYSNHGLVSTSAPHEDACIESLGDWKRAQGKARPLYIQYTSDFDCGYETEWWYCIKDTCFDLSSVKAKRRYEINKGLKNFELRVIDPADHITDINSIRDKLFAQYPEEYRTQNDPQNVEITYKTRHSDWISVGAFQGDALRGYLDAEIKKGYIDFTRMCVDPEYEKQGVNFALVYGLLEETKEYIERGFYVCDGARTIRHKTKFQDWLIKYFGFRKAYCLLHVECKPVLRAAIRVLSPFEAILAKTKHRAVYNVLCFMRMYRIAAKA